MIRSGLLFLNFLLFLLMQTSFAQTDTTFLKVASANVVQRYTDLIKDQKALYSGTEYKELPETSHEYPYFISLNPPVDDEYFWRSGDIVYNEEYYPNVTLLYDLTADMVVTENWAGDDIMLVKEKVSSFVIDDLEFRNFVQAEKIGLPKDGFYEVLYKGPTQVVGRHTKTKQEKVDQTRVTTYYIYKQRYYVLKNGKFYSISTKGNLMKLLRDQKSGLRTFIRENKIKVSKKTPYTFAQVAAHYDTLTNAKK
jgi:hypothetical protein